MRSLESSVLRKLRDHVHGAGCLCAALRRRGDDRGTVTAGQPILAVEDIEEYIPFKAKSGDSRDLFALRVKGESMINAGILDGDVIVARRVSTAYNGEIVVALIEDEATVKTFYKENGHYRLQPENDTMDPIIVDSCLILGKVISCLRFYE